VLISADNHVFPCWAPDWLREQVECPDCSNGTHPRLRMLAKWLTIYFAEHEGAAARWLSYAAERCERSVPPGEVDRLLLWAYARFSGPAPTAEERVVSGQGTSGGVPTPADLNAIYKLAKTGPNLEQYRQSSSEKPAHRRNTDRILRAWARYAGIDDPLVCFGSRDCFWTRPLSAVRDILRAHEQIVPSPMCKPVGLTMDGHWSEHSKAACGPRMFLVTEFDFSKTTPRGKPTIWVPLIERCEALGLSMLDVQASLLWQLGRERPLWMTVFSGSKSLQGWFPCRGEDETALHNWFNSSPRRLGACSSTWCVSQFVRMPDGQRAPNREGKSVRQDIVYYDPKVL
jgi:hypothetical protein